MLPIKNKHQFGFRLILTQIIAGLPLFGVAILFSSKIRNFSKQNLEDPTPTYAVCVPTRNPRNNGIRLRGRGKGAGNIQPGSIGSSVSIGSGSVDNPRLISSRRGTVSYSRPPSVGQTIPSSRSSPLTPATVRASVNEECAAGSIRPAQPPALPWRKANCCPSSCCFPSTRRPLSQDTNRGRLLRTTTIEVGLSSTPDLSCKYD